MKVNVKDKKFLSCVKNTFVDLLRNNNQNLEMISYLKEIYNKKELTIINRQAIFLVIEVRKEMFDYIKLIQDKKSFKIINKEHKYMENFINKYFEYNEYPNSTLRSVTFKNL